MLTNIRKETSPLNVLYLLNHAGKAGTERYVETLARTLSADGRVKPFFAYNEGGLLVERMEEMGVPVRQLTMSSRYDLKAAKALAALCKEWQIDLIHCHYLRENYIAMLAKTWNKHIRVVYTNHFILPNNWHTRLSNKLLDGRQDEMIAVCTKGREQLMENGWNGKHIRVIFNAVDPAQWAGTDSTLRQELGIPEDRFVMLCASRFAHDKGHPYLLKSLKKLTELSSKPFTMVLAGDGELLEPMKALAAELGLTDEQLKFVGFRKDIRNLYHGADLYINSSQHEALSFLIVEAMASGLPAVITDMGGNRDILEGPEQGGLLAVYDDPDSMAAAMQRFLEDDAFRASCRENALRNIQDRFALDKMAAATFRTYTDAAAR